MAAISGRPDGRLANYIYASGAGGVCRDMRYSAWGLTQEDFAEADLSVKSGEYRGREALTSPLARDLSGASSSSVLYFESEGLAPKESSSDKTPFVWVRVSDLGDVTFRAGYTEIGNGEWHEMVVVDNQGRNILIVEGQGVASILSGNPTTMKLDILISGSSPGYILSNTSIADEYTHTEVIGHPANILLCDDLKDGWVGSWNPTIPDGQTKAFKLSRTVISTTASILITGNQGSSWSYFPITQLNNVLNAMSASYASNEVAICQYKTKAKMTENSPNLPWYPTINSEVYASSDGLSKTSRGVLLKYALVGGVSGTSNYANGPVQSLNLSSKGSILFDSGEVIASDREAYLPSHGPILIDGEESISAFKALNYNVVENQQGFINYAYTELTYDETAGDWGDDSKIHIADNQTTMLDTNGNTVKVGTARIVEPLGWIKNDK